MSVSNKDSDACQRHSSRRAPWFVRAEERKGPIVSRELRSSQRATCLWRGCCPSKLSVLPSSHRYGVATGAVLFGLNALTFLATSAFWHRGNTFTTSTEWRGAGVGFLLAFAALASLMASLPRYAAAWSFLIVPFIVAGAAMATHGGIDRWTGVFGTDSPGSASEFELYAELAILGAGAHYLLLTAQGAVALEERYHARDRWWMSAGAAVVIMYCMTFDIPDPLWTLWKGVLALGVASLFFGLQLRSSRKIWLEDVAAGRVQGFSIRGKSNTEDEPLYEFARVRGSEPTRILTFNEGGSEVTVGRVP